MAAGSTVIGVAAVPLSWRKISPLHKQLGVRSARFVYPGGGGAPVLATPAIMNFRYGPEAGMDRIIGFSLLLGKGADTPEFTMSELATGWLFDHVFTAGQGATVYGNIETLPDEINLSFSFAAATTRNVYLSFFNFEVVPALY